MICKHCHYRDQADFVRCPICGRFAIAKLLVNLFARMLYWIGDRRLCLISKRRHWDNKLHTETLMAAGCRGVYRLWWKYRLFDVIPIFMIQDQQALAIFDVPQPEQKPPQNTTDAGGMMS